MWETGDLRAGGDSLDDEDPGGKGTPPYTSVCAGLLGTNEEEDTAPPLTREESGLKQ